MKIKSDIFVQEIDGMQYLVSMGGDAFSGIVRSNPTAAFVIRLLQEETTPERLAEAVMNEYEDAQEAQVKADIDELLGRLRELNIIEE